MHPARQPPGIIASPGTGSCGKGGGAAYGLFRFAIHSRLPLLSHPFDLCFFFSHTLQRDTVLREKVQEVIGKLQSKRRKMSE